MHAPCRFTSPEGIRVDLRPAESRFRGASRTRWKAFEYGSHAHPLARAGKRSGPSKYPMNAMDTSHPKRERLLRNAGILLGVFLLGLIPPLVRTAQLKGDLENAQTQLERARTRDFAALTYLEVSRNNFGVAAQHASTLYDRLANAATNGEEPLRSVAARALQDRDAVMKMLATADPAVRLHVQELTSRLLALDTETSARARTQ